MKLYNGDCLDVMNELEPNSIDCIITSPPYEDLSGAGYTKTRKDALFVKIYHEFLSKLFTGYYRILKDNGQIFFNIKSKTSDKTLRTPHWIEFEDSFEKFKLKSFIIWKYAGSFDSTKKRFHLDYEVIYHLSKGDDIYLNLDSKIHDPLSSVWYVPHNIPISERLHPTQMPTQLVERILDIATKEHHVVFDSFMGVGTTGVVCKKMNRDFIGVELTEEYYNLAKKRIDDYKQTNLNDTYE